MLGVAWVAFILSWIVNILYYKIHPAEVEVFSVDADKTKLKSSLPFSTGKIRIFVKLLILKSLLLFRSVLLEEYEIQKR